MTETELRTLDSLDLDELRDEIEQSNAYARALEERVMQLEAVVLKLTTKIDGYAIDYANCGEHKR